MKAERLILVIVVAAGCARAHGSPATPAEKIRLVTLPAESDAFPGVAKAITSALGAAKLAGVDETVASKVSMEVVQLSIECVDPSTTCYDAVAKSLSANRLLFAAIESDGKKPKIAITVFDAGKAPRTKERTFDTVAAAIAGVDKLVTEATR